MLKQLLKKQMLELNSGFFYDSKKGKLRSKLSSIIFILAYAVLMIGMLGMIFAYLANSLCSPLHAAGLDWMYFCIMTLIAIALGVFGSVFNTYSSLYKAKDNDLLLSMPIPVRYILVSRLCGVYLMGLMFSGIVMLPTLIVYFAVTKPGVMAVIGSVLLTLYVSLFVLVLSCLLGWAVAKISSRLKNRSLVIVLLSLLFIFAYYYIYYYAAQLLQTLLMSAAVMGEEIKQSAYAVYLVGRCGEGSILALLIIGAAVAAMLALIWCILSRSFIRIATTSHSAAKVKYREKNAAVRSGHSALLYRESRRLLASSNYMLNCALGTLFLLICAVFVLVKGDILIDFLTNAFGFGPDLSCAVLAVALCFVVSMNDLSAASVSLEGKNLWIAQSLPVDPRHVLRAKLELHALLTALPALLCSLCTFAVLHPSLPMAILSALLPLLFSLLTACGGLAINLARPNLSWTNEVAAVKQSFGVLVAMFGGWAVALGIGLAFYALRNALSPLAYMGCCCVLLAAVCLLLHRLIMGWGAKKFSSL